MFDIFTCGNRTPDLKLGVGGLEVGLVRKRIIEGLDRCLAISSSAIAEAFGYIAEGDQLEVWRVDGAKDMAQWLSARANISNWAARRWIHASHVLPDLPRTHAALASGDLSVEKVVELARFAEPSTEERLIRWAKKVSPAAVRRTADLEHSQRREDVIGAHTSRSLHWWWSVDKTQLEMHGMFPADQGMVLIKTLDRMAERLPDILDEDCEELSQRDPEGSLEARRADALVALASTRIAQDQDPDRATVVVHADIDVLAGAEHNCSLEGGPVISAEMARRLACDARLQFVLHNPEGATVGIGSTSRIVPEWLKRQLRWRDGGCTFPGCEAKRWLHAHHIEFWEHHGPTDLDNLILVCAYHHRLVHEHGWSVRLLEDDTTQWFRPGGAPHLIERAPPDQLMIAV